MTPNPSAAMGAVERAARTASRPSELKITDLRVARVHAPYDYILIRLDTNQGVYGVGEGHESSHVENVLQYKSILLGQNPCNVDMIFSAMKPYGHWGTEGSGVSGIEMALWDLVGKVYGVPCYQFLGGKYRDSIRLYADTPSPKEPTPEGYAERVAGRKARGITLCKFDVGLGVLPGYVPDGLLGQPAKDDYALGRRWRAHGAVGTQLTDRGLARFREIVVAVRERVGWEVPLAIDHFGPLTVKDGIRLGRALEGLGIAWLEDILPVKDWKGNLKVTQAIEVPTLNGEQAFTLDSLRKMIKHHAVDIIQPDLVTVGGLMETKRVADYAERHDMPTVLHSAGSPIMFMANIHAAAAIRSFVAQEIHSLDIPFWRDLVTGLDDPLIVDGYVRVPDAPGLGVDFNLEAIREHLRIPGPGLFEPTDAWDTPKLGWHIPP
ncbi:MAG: mandelate racemase/muconate lactonizing enzyme family protein, partial [Chloroflexota bacterium]